MKKESWAAANLEKVLAVCSVPTAEELAAAKAALQRMADRSGFGKVLEKK